METTPFTDARAVMQRALEIAALGLGCVEPNPPVGAVIVDEQLNLIAEGRHERFGGPHAEANALKSAGEDASGQTLFVTLEPCSHQGKTPPCSQAVIDAKIGKVIVAMLDPSPHSSGAGVQQLREAGIDVEVGLLEEEAQRLTAPFLKLLDTNLPYVHAKWAMTLDGKIASRTGHSMWISSEQSRAVVHAMRGRMDAVVVGSATAALDDPLLTARPPGPRTATRIVIGSADKLSLDSRLVASVAEVPILLATTGNASPQHLEKLQQAGVEVVQYDDSISKGVPLVSLLEELGRRRFTNILVEGGGALLGSFFDEQLVDEVHVFVAPKIVGGRQAVSPVSGEGLEQIPQLASLQESEVEMIGEDVYIHGPLITRRATEA